MRLPGRTPWLVLAEYREGHGQPLQNNEVARRTYCALPPEEQKSFHDIALMEASAFAVWRTKQGFRHPLRNADYDAWDLLDNNVKASFVPDNPQAVIGKDPYLFKLISPT